MDFEAALNQLRMWCDRPVTVVVEPDHSVMHGRLRELDSTGTDGAMFAVDREDRPTTGVAVALFRDAFASARLEGSALYVEQGRMEIIVLDREGTGAPEPAR
ncbi:MAG TPA: hypothetical protein VNZ62_07930 [Capillimicrobium sp.]|nr:hypothetical protein [Capillimicrobium sp.]